MNFGITARNAHLNVRLSPPDFGHPEFAGRYFLGQPYLWGHGEATDILIRGGDPRIVPIQKADKDRQETTGSSGEQFGLDDAFAICAKLTACLDMGELGIPGRYIAVFLEVDDNTKLSEEYWTSWCSGVGNALYTTVKETEINGVKVLLPSFAFPFIPCICCQFKKLNTGKYAPDEDIQKCLDSTGKKYSGKQSKCRGFWARVSDIPEYHSPEPALDWTIFNKYDQPQGDTIKQAVPVLLWRYMDSTDFTKSEIAQKKITLDAASAGVINSMLKVENWKLQLQDDAGNEGVRPPTVFGFDSGSNISAQIVSLAKKAMRVRELPSTWVIINNNGDRINLRKGVMVNVTGKPTFLGRYYTGKPGNIDARNLTSREASTISRAGIDCITFFQGKVGRDHIADWLTNKIHPKQGKLDALDAFLYAADVIRQPPHTPIYFVIDIPISIDGHSRSPYIPTTDEIITYFLDVNDGYQEYLQQKKAADQVPVPYYIGVYACSNVLDACYALGLATHFWQAWPIYWGDDPPTLPNLQVWPHNNIWQVMLWDIRPDGYWPESENRAIEMIVVPGGVDFNVAWGDTGGWKIR
jgi:hypothetical protein